jgi:2-methylisocitrate lyase-like PEP mutase family enzyme
VPRSPEEKNQNAQAQQVLELHRDKPLLVLVNVWDAASARTVAALPGCRAIATASWSIAASLGVPDGEVMSRSDMLAAVERIVAAVELPVTADLEAGYGDSPYDVGETIAAALSTGVAGCNLEDQQRPVVEACRRIGAARARADAEGIAMVVNARLDSPIDTVADMEGAVRRARAYLDAGADCVFPIGARGAHVLSRLVEQVDGPVNAFGVPGGPSVRELEDLGVARVSFGPGPLGAALAALHRAGAELLAGEPVGADLGFRPPGV